MLNSQFRYTFNIECAYKKTSFIKIAVFFLTISSKLSDLQSKGETTKLLPHYPYNKIFYLQNCKDMTFEKITNHLKYI